MHSIKLKKLLQSLSLVALLAGSLQAHAKDGTFFGQEASGKWIIAAKAAKIDPNDPEINDADATGIVVGYEFDKEIGNGGTSSFELEYLTGDGSQIDNSFDYDVKVINAFFTYRTAGDVYLKLKGGLSYVDIDVVENALLDNDFEDTSLAGGIGIGYRILDHAQVELEYSKDAGNSDLGILSLNGMLTF